MSPGVVPAFGENEASDCHRAGDAGWSPASPGAVRALPDELTASGGDTAESSSSGGIVELGWGWQGEWTNAKFVGDLWVDGADGLAAAGTVILVGDAGVWNGAPSRWACQR